MSGPSRYWTKQSVQAGRVIMLSAGARSNAPQQAEPSEQELQARELKKQRAELGRVLERLQDRDDPPSAAASRCCHGGAARHCGHFGGIDDKFDRARGHPPIDQSRRPRRRDCRLAFVLGSTIGFRRGLARIWDAKSAITLD